MIYGYVFSAVTEKYIYSWEIDVLLARIFWLIAFIVAISFQIMEKHILDGAVPTQVISSKGGCEVLPLTEVLNFESSKP